MRKLRDFTRISLKAGESKTVKFVIDKEDLSFINKNLERVTEAGEFEIQIGDQKRSFMLKDQ
jgi:beta-glucosidase